jgi:hypothetical protein
MCVGETAIGAANLNTVVHVTLNSIHQSLSRIEPSVQLNGVLLRQGELYSLFFVTYTGFVCSTLSQWPKNFPKIMEPPPSFRLQKGDMKQVPY